MVFVGLMLCTMAAAAAAAAAVVVVVMYHDTFRARSRQQRMEAAAE
jgi:hypothetical protein